MKSMSMSSGDMPGSSSGSGAITTCGGGGGRGGGCLLCNSPRMRNMKINFLKSLPTLDSREGPSANSNLWARFVLEELLQFTPQEMNRLMMRRGGQEPANWFEMWICGRCAGDVRDFRAVYIEEEDEEGSEDVVNSIRKRIKDRLEKALEAVVEDNNNITDVVQAQEIREFLIRDDGNGVQSADAGRKNRRLRGSDTVSNSNAPSSNEGSGRVGVINLDVDVTENDQMVEHSNLDNVGVNPRANSAAEQSTVTGEGDDRRLEEQPLDSQFVVDGQGPLVIVDKERPRPVDDVGHANPPQESEIQAQSNNENEGFGGIEGDVRAPDVAENDMMEHCNQNNTGHKSSTDSLAEQGTMINDHGRLDEHTSDSQLVEEGQGLDPNSHDTLGEMPKNICVGRDDEPVCSTKRLGLRKSAKERRNVCEKCGKMFTLKSCLINHLRYVHNGERPFGCTACGKRFTCQSNLKTHMRVHTGEKSFSCPECVMNFAQRNALISHFKVHHADRPFSSEVSKDGVNSTQKKVKGRLMRGLEPVVKEAKTRSKVKVDESRVHSFDVDHVNPPQGSEIQDQSNNGKEGFGGMEGDLRASDVAENDMIEHWNQNNIMGHKSDNDSLAEQGTMINDHGRLGEHPSNSQLMVEGQGLDPNSRDTLGEMPMDLDVGCLETVSTAKGLRLHRSAKGPRVLCGTCGTMFANKYNLIRHIGNVHNGERRVGCTACGKRFPYESYLKAHMVVHNGERPFGCTVCGRRFRRKSYMKIHIGSVHNGERPFGCTACGKRFPFQSNLKTHMRVHTGEKSFSCPECVMKFAQRNALISHFKVHHADSPFSSEDSKDVVNSTRKKVKGRLMRGLEPVVKEAKKRSKVKVDESGVHSGDVGHKTRRLRGSKKTVSNSNGEFDNQGLFGGVSLGTPDVPENDKKEHSNLNSLGYNYSLAEQGTTTGDDRRLEDSQLEEEEGDGTGDPNSHDTPLRTLGEMPMDIICVERDDETAGSTKDLGLRESAKDRRKICEKCGEMFTLKSGLIKHLREVHKESPFGCTYCGKSFSYEPALKIHMKFHTGEKQISCDVCDKLFTRLGYLRIHLRTHTGEKPFSCSVCNKKFTQKSTLNSHVIRMHDGKSNSHNKNLI